MDHYTLRSGKTIDVSLLPDADREHIGRVERLIAGAADYHAVYRAAYRPLKEGQTFTAKDFIELRKTPRYKIIHDMVWRYWERLSGE